MKKILIFILGVILLIVLVISFFKGISIGKAKILSASQLKYKSIELDSIIIEANTQINQNYAKAVNNIDSAIEKLRNVKTEYEDKIMYYAENPELGITQIEKYKIEYLWGILGNYAKDEGLRIDLNVEETTIKDTYNIKFVLKGSYVGITNFLYNIENNDELNYKIVGFKLEPTTVSTTSKSGIETKTTDIETLQATFKVENIIIKFD